MKMLDRLIDSLRSIIRSEFPNIKFLGIYEYAIQGVTGGKIDADPTDTSLGLPSIAKIELIPSILGESVKPTVGKLCRVQFINGLSTRPVVVSCDPPNVDVTVDTSGDQTHSAGGDQNISAGLTGTATVRANIYPATEHVLTVEAAVNMFIGFLYLIQSAGNPTTWTGTIFNPGTFPVPLETAVTQWLNACNLPIPPTAVAPGGLLDPVIYAALQAALTAKLPNVLGITPGVGAPYFKTG